MSNSISDIGSTAANTIDQVGGSTSAPDVRAQSSATVPNASPTPSDATSLSPLGNLLGQIARTATAQNPIRQDVVTRIKAQITSGTYQPDANAVATKVYRALKAVQ